MNYKMAEYLRYDDEVLNEVSLRSVKEELKENNEIRKESLEKLKKKLTEKVDLNPCLDNEFLLANLRVTKFDITKAYQRILRFYEERWNLPNIFQDYLPSTVKSVESSRQVFACPYRSKDHSAVLLIKRGDYDPTKVSYDLICRGMSMIGDMIIYHPLNQMCGFTCIMDFKTSTWGTWSEYTPSRLKMIAKLIQKTIPMRIRKVHIINAPSIYYFLYSIMYPFLSVKMRNRIILHKTYTSLHSYIEPINLPKEYGGYLEESELINMFEKLYKMQDFFQNFSKYGYMRKKQ